MGPTFSTLVTASLLLGQTGSSGTLPNSKTITYPANQPLVVEEVPAARQGWSWPVLTKIGGMFKREERFEAPVVAPKGTTTRTYQTAPPPLAEPVKTAPSQPDIPRRMPTTSNKDLTLPPAETRPAPVPNAQAAQHIATVTHQLPVAKTKSPILPQLANKIGRDEKFEWVTGQLENENGTWVLYYATPETVDPHHGRVVLQTKANLSAFRRGDLVSARGQLVTRGGTATYRAATVDLIEQVGRP